MAPGAQRRWGLLSVLCVSFGSRGGTFLDGRRCTPQPLAKVGASAAGNGAWGRRPRVTARVAGEVALLDSVDTWFSTQPYQSAFFVASVKATASDLVAQKQEQAASEAAPDTGGRPACQAAPRPPNSQSPKNLLDTIKWKRTLAFFLYGGLYQGCVLNFIFNDCYPVWFGEGQDLQTITVKVLFDLFVLSPFLTLPIAYIIKALVASNADLPGGFRHYVEDAGNDLLIKYWLLWGPVSFFIFGVVPAQWRILFIACVSFFWLIILSTISSRKDAEADGREESPTPRARVALEP